MINDRDGGYKTGGGGEREFRCAKGGAHKVLSFFIYCGALKLKGVGHKKSYHPSIGSNSKGGNENRKV